MNKPTYLIGSISSGTMRLQDLFEAFMDTLRALDSERYAQFVKDNPEACVWMTIDDDNELKETLDDAVNSLFDILKIQSNTIMNKNTVTYVSVEEYEARTRLEESKCATSISILQLRDNLDGLEEETLYQLGLNTGNVSIRQQAREVFPNQPKGYVRSFKSLRNYAVNKAVAMGQRRQGLIETAQQYESICDSIYERLPDYARFF